MPEDDSLAGIEDTQEALVLAMERTALIARYFVYFGLMLPLILTGHIASSAWSLTVLTVVVLAHSLFAHWVFLTGRHEWFRSRLNFIVYLAGFTLVLAVTGMEESPGYLLYILFIVGYGAHARRLSQVLAVTALCAFLYLGILVVARETGPMSLPLESAVARFTAMALTGLLTGHVSEALRRMEETHLSQVQALASSEATLRTILNSAADPILVFDENELIVEANPHACEVIGLSRDELLGQRARAFLFDDGTLPTKMAALRARGETFSEEILIARDDEERQVELMIRAFQRLDQRFFVAIAHDVTDKKALQEAIRRANAQLEGLNWQLQQLEEIRRHYLASLSQRIRSPMTAVLGYVEMLVGGDLGEITLEQQKALQNCRRCILRIFRVMDEAQELEYGGEWSRDGRTTPESPPALSQPMTEYETTERQ